MKPPEPPPPAGLPRRDFLLGGCAAAAILGLPARAEAARVRAPRRTCWHALCRHHRPLSGLLPGAEQAEPDPLDEGAFGRASHVPGTCALSLGGDVAPNPSDAFLTDSRR